MAWRDEVREAIRKKAPQPGQRFDIEDVYAFEEELAAKHPQNSHIRATIRDKLQELRDLDEISFDNDEGSYTRLFEDRVSGTGGGAA